MQLIPQIPWVWVWFFLSGLNVVQKETMWSLILYVVCSMYMYVVICKIDHCIHIHWCIPMGLGHNDPWVESHMWPQQMWGQRSSRVNNLGSSFSKKVHCIHILWCIFMGLGHNDLESHIWPQQMWGQRSSRGQWPLVGNLQNWSLYPHTSMYSHGTWTQWSLGRVTRATSTDVGSKVI